jgi:hypothetical protein
VSNTEESELLVYLKSKDVNKRFFVGYRQCPVRIKIGNVRSSPLSLKKGNFKTNIHIA